MLKEKYCLTCNNCGKTTDLFEDAEELHSFLEDNAWIREHRNEYFCCEACYQEDLNKSFKEARLHNYWQNI